MRNRRNSNLLRKGIAAFLMLILVCSNSAFALGATENGTSTESTSTETVEDSVATGGSESADSTSTSVDADSMENSGEVSSNSNDGEETQSTEDSSEYQAVGTTEVEGADEESQEILDELEEKESVIIMSQTSAPTEKVKLTYNETIAYENYATHHFTVTCDGKKIVAYCIEPKTTTAGKGTYTAKPYNSKLMTKALYYSYANPGYDKYMKPYLSKVNRKSCYKGSDGIYALCHIMLSYIYDGQSSSGDAFYGCSSSTKKVVKNMVKKVKSWPDVPNQPEIGLSSESFKAQWNESTKEQEISEITVVGTKGNSMSLPVPEGATIKKDNETIESGNVKMKVGDTFNITAPSTVNGKYTSPKIAGSLKGFQPYIIKPSGKQKQVFSVSTISYLSYSIEWADFGNLELIKTSANPDITENSSSSEESDDSDSDLSSYYSLEGAEYELYRKTKDDSENGELYGTLKTDSEGKATLNNLPYGEYYLKEIKAPTGFELDESKTDVEVDYDAVSATVSDKPIVPNLETYAVEKESGEKTITEGGDVTITDTVKYEGVIPGVEYTIKGRLMKQSSEEELKGSDSEITFTPENSEGTVEMEYIVNSEDLAGTTLVAFEKVYHEDTLLATHENINDEAESVNIVKKPETSSDKPKTPSKTSTENTSPQTGDVINIILMIMIMLLTIFIATVIIIYNRTKIR